MRRRARQAILVALLSLIGAGSSVAQTSTSTTAPPPSALPANWQQLSPTDFATLVQGYFQQGTFQTLNPVDQYSLAAQGALLFSQQNIATTTLSYQTLETLAAVGQSQLDQWSMASAKSAIMGRSDNWAGQLYAAMKAKIVLMGRLNVPDPVAFREARNWVLAGGTQAQVPPNDFVYDFARQMFADAQVIDRSFSVSWAAQLNAPQSGDYSFFIIPIDLNSGFSNPSANVSMTVLVAGQAIITATPPTLPNPLSPTYQTGAQPTSNWLARSNPITLTAGTPVSLQVTYSVEMSQTLPAGALHAMLFWQGPGITQQVVPTNAVSQAQTGTPGFQATYTWTAKGQPQSLTRIDPLIDFAWTGSSLILAQDPTSANQAAANMWQAMTATSFINTYANATPAPTLHPFLAHPQDASCGLSTANRQAFLDLLIQNPTLLDAMDAPHAVAFFQAFRVGAQDKALNVFGTWATRQADLACTLANERFFDADNRLALAAMAIMTTQQLPTQAATLQQQFLQTPDGRCSLPVAYMLSYSNLGLGSLNNWASTLDATLANQALTGDLRVNWLMARAHAAEFTRTAPQHYPFGQPYPSSWPIDGKSYVFQALQAAQSPAVKVRVVKDIAARMTSAGDYQNAINFLSQQSNSLPAAQQAMVIAWQQRIAGYAALQSQVIQNQQAASQKAYIMTLTARRDQAASQGNSAAVSRYNALISAASNQP